MYAKVMRDQFQFRDESIVHMPTGAEFTRVVGNGDSMLIFGRTNSRDQSSDCGSTAFRQASGKKPNDVSAAAPIMQ